MCICLAWGTPLMQHVRGDTLQAKRAGSTAAVLKHCVFSTPLPYGNRMFFHSYHNRFVWNIHRCPIDTAPLVYVQTHAFGPLHISLILRVPLIGQASRTTGRWGDKRGARAGAAPQLTTQANAAVKTDVAISPPFDRTRLQGALVELQRCWCRCIG